jgi:hypothetical protein
MFILYTFYGLFNFRLARFYGLYPYHQTDPSSLVYSSLYTAKLAFPVCYNYLLLVHLLSDNKTVAGSTAFEQAMGDLNMVPLLGNNFQQYFPCVIFFFLVLNIFQLFSTPKN